MGRSGGAEVMRVGDAVEVLDSVMGWQPGVVLGGDKNAYEVSMRTKHDRVHLGDVAAMLSVVCGGSRDSKVAMAMPYYESDGGLRLPALSAYLTSVFCALFEAQPSARGDVSAQHLGVATARRAFYENGVNEEAELPVARFREWYSSTEEEDMSPEQARAAAELARQSFGEIYVEDAFARLSQWADGDGKISRSAFEAALGATATAAAASLFEAFDTDHDGGIDLAELAAGLSVWCRGSRLEKISATFQLFDTNGDGMIDQSEMARYLSSVFRVVLSSSPEARREARGADPEALGEATAAHVFETADRNHDGVLSLEEFARWYERSFSSLDSMLSNSDVVRVLASTLRGRDPRALYARLMARADPLSNRLSREDFYLAFEHLDERTDELEAVLSKAFDLFDANSDGDVDSNELAAGLAALCGGDRDTKVRFCFGLFDADQDGYVSRPELEACLRSVFRVVTHTSSRNCVTPDQLATATAEAILAKADADGDGRVSYHEFDAWLAKPQINNNHNARGENGVAPRDSFEEHVTEENRDELALPEDDRRTSELTRARHLLGLTRLSIDEIMDAFLEAHSTHLTKRHLTQLCRRFARLSGLVDKASLQLTANLADSVFNALRRDADEKEEEVNIPIADLVSGLVALADAPAAEKIDAAFGLYDQQRTLDSSQLYQYLRAVYCTLFAASPALADAVAHGAAPHDLAKATADACFKELGSDSPCRDRVDVDDFAAFVERGSPGDQVFN